MKPIFHAIRDEDLIDLKTGDYKTDTVTVFCGFYRHEDTVRAVLEIATAVAFHYPQVGIDDMTVHKIQPNESHFHKGLMTIKFSMPTEVVELDLDQYTRL